MIHPIDNTGKDAIAKKHYFEIAILSEAAWLLMVVVNYIAANLHSNKILARGNVGAISTGTWKINGSKKI